MPALGVTRTEQGCVVIVLSDNGRCCCLCQLQRALAAKGFTCVCFRFVFVLCLMSWGQTVVISLSLDSTGQQQLLRPVDIDFIMRIFALKGKALGCIQVFPR